MSGHTPPFSLRAKTGVALGIPRERAVSMKRFGHVSAVGAKALSP